MTREATAASPVQPPSRLPMVVLAILGICAIAALFWPAGKSPEVSGGFLLDANGRPSPLGERLAPVTLVHFWATWCPPCVTEIPAVLRLRKDIEAPGSVAVLLVAVGDTPDKVKTFLGASSGQALYDPRWDVAHRYGTEQVPETYLLVNGKVAEKFVGATDWDSPAIRERLQAHIAARR